MRVSFKYFVIILPIFFVTCREIDDFIPAQEDVSFDFGQEFGDASDTLLYNFDGQEKIVVTTPRGTEFVFKRDMFLLPNGEYCQCEKVTIRIIEVDKKKDYLVHQTPTVSGGQILESAGAYHVSAFFEGQPLQLAPGHQVCFLLPSRKLDDAMELFYGEENSTGFNWIPANSISGSGAFAKAGQWQFYDSTAVIVGYECFSDRMEWINVDKFVSEGSKNPVCLGLDTSYTNENTVVFALLGQENSIIELKANSGNNRFCAANLPSGKQVTFIGINKKGEDKYELAVEKTTISSNHFQSLNFQPRSFEAIKEFLADL